MKNKWEKTGIPETMDDAITEVNKAVVHVMSKINAGNYKESIVSECKGKIDSRADVLTGYVMRDYKVEAKKKGDNEAGQPKDSCQKLINTHLNYSTFVCDMKKKWEKTGLVNSMDVAISEVSKAVAHVNSEIDKGNYSESIVSNYKEKIDTREDTLTQLVMNAYKTATEEQKRQLKDLIR